MMPGFQFATAGRILFGEGTSHQIPTLAADLGHAALLVGGNDLGRVEFALTGLKQRGLAVTLFQVSGEPTLRLVQGALQRARNAGVDVVVAVGGGSALDTGKAVAGLLAAEGPIADYLEVVGKGLPLTRPALPFIAVPTTAGTGSEVTRNAVLALPEPKAKVSLRSHLLLPTVAVVDPELTYGLPPDLTAATGLDALTQLIEPFLSRQGNPLTDSICRDGIARAARSLPRAIRQGNDQEARRDMALASLYGGMALANAGLGAVHGLAGPLGGLVPAPHGALCARLLPEVLAVNARALRQRHPDPGLEARFDEVARLLTGKPVATASDGIAWIRDLFDLWQPRSLGSYGVTPAMFPLLVEKARASSSMRTNAIDLTSEELLEILSLSI